MYACSVTLTVSGPLPWIPRGAGIQQSSLRALEYYDGILILTTNRVGTFDEAFKSRIHLALRYLPLDEEQRVEIRRNFIHMLSRTKERVDINDFGAQRTQARTSRAERTADHQV
ncbi:hypothetical protein B0T17DRAFT_602173 [Bombardia bombarda]|uniref:ATPase AAA-type core domain-containing protein n=1 Tax=Bombardia bombarda TaxID=252184 RepID=A0AA39WGN8_9PEZI|nr:hypothetical protein B0T17DRAFT_602173 [Bombardia bombarda]